MLPSPHRRESSPRSAPQTTCAGAGVCFQSMQVQVQVALPKSMTDSWKAPDSNGMRLVTASLAGGPPNSQDRLAVAALHQGYVLGRDSRDPDAL